MANAPSEFEIDPLNDSEAEERAKLAAMRLGQSEDGMGTPTGGPARSTKQTRKIDTAYQRYLFGTAGSGEHPTWSDSTAGRAAIRLVSRGVFGAAAFAWGGRYAFEQLKGYTPHNVDSSKPLQVLAKRFDSTFGAAIKYAVKLGARISHTPQEAERIAERAMTFRQTLAGGGRSYGAEVVGVTFDFAMASIGDALARNTIEVLDPNTKKTWLVNDKGETAAPGEKKHFDFGKWAKACASTGWRILSKNQGEDWAAGIVYVFQMKAQRSWLNKLFKGHAIAFDNNWNGGAYKVDSAGKIIGDYQLPGALDLHARFVGYNWYTLMFREGYDTIANGWQKWKENGFALSSLVPNNLNPIDGAGWLARYVTKSFIKANIYMQPAVIPFWMIRSPQSKWRGQQIAADGSGIVNTAPVANPFDKNLYANYATNTMGEKVEKGFSRMLNPFGWASHTAGSYMTGLGNKIFTGNGKISSFLGGVGSAQRESFMRGYMDAAFSYTPYMWAKAETQLRVDERPPDGSLGAMDKAIYKLMGHAARFELRDVWSSTKDIAKLATHFEREPHAAESTPPMPKPAPARETPRPTVMAEGRVRHHDPVSLDTANDNFNTANDNLRATRQKRATGTDDAHPDQRWAETVAGRSLAGQFQPAPTTRH